MPEPAVPRRRLGTGGLEVSAQGLGTLGMVQSYGRADEPEALATIARAIELGIFLLDTADVYGEGRSERLVGRAIAGRRHEVVLESKFGNVIRPDGTRTIDGRPQYVRTACEASLARLATDHLDLYYLHRVDPTVPIEETVGAMARLVEAGLVRHLGLSEVSAPTLERACAIHPIAALQSEWSLWSRDLEHEVLPVARRLGVGIVAYAPLGRGFLTGRLTANDSFEPDDVRRTNPRFVDGNFERNLAVLGRVTEIASAKGITPGQLALAWLLAQGDDVVPIPGTKRRRYLEENAAACAVRLTTDDLARLDEIAAPGAWAGERYAQPSMTVYGDTPPLS